MYYDFHLPFEFFRRQHQSYGGYDKEGIKQNLKGMCFTEYTDLDFPEIIFTFFWLI